MGANVPEPDHGRDRYLTSHQYGDVGRVWNELLEPPFHHGESETRRYGDDPQKQTAGVARQRCR